MLFLSYGNFVKIIYPSSSDGGRVFVKLKDVDMSTTNCSLAEGAYYSLYKDHSMFAENMELIQMAAVTGREIFLRIYENSNVCEIFYLSKNTCL